MFIDQVKCDYEYLNTLKNIVWEGDKDAMRKPRAGVIVHEEIQPVLDILMRERPLWRFKSRQTWPVDGVWRVTRFSIFDGDEELGVLYYEPHWRDHSSQYVFDNFRLTKERSSSRKPFSSKPDIAAKRILKAFHLKTPKERAAEAHTATRTVVADAVNEAEWAVRRLKAQMEKELFRYALDNWGILKVALGSEFEKADFPALMQAYTDAHNLHTMQNCVVRVEANDTYLISRHHNDSYQAEVHTNATLPDKLRGPLGLLKMLEEKQMVAGLGLRVNHNTFLILDGTE
jgi:hypothetical protein